MKDIKKERCAIDGSMLKSKQRVYVHPHGWGELLNRQEAGNWHVEFDSGIIRKIQHGFISFTPYNLETGGFSQELPKPELKEGQMIWVKENDDIEWYVRPFRNDTMINKSTIDIWDEYSILNPHPDSIEAEAIDYLRNVSYLYESNPKGSGIHDDINEFLTRIDSHERSK